jgi:hypothetical protein
VDHQDPESSKRPTSFHGALRGKSIYARVKYFICDGTPLQATAGKQQSAE